MILVTGGAGFIGSHFVCDWLAHSAEPVLNLDALTYAGKLQNLRACADNPRHHFVQGDLCDAPLLARLFAQYQPRAVVHLAAESHVDRSHLRPGDFIRSNVEGSFTLLQATLNHWRTLAPDQQVRFRYLQISTDEVFGSLGPLEPPCSEDQAYRPTNPYSASKAAADHLVRAWQHTHGLPCVTTHCSNNYGPRQFPEKLIPFMVQRALAGQSLPLYGDGLHSRDWLHVQDHCAALRCVLEQGQPGEVYNISAGNELSNRSVVEALCAHLDTLHPRAQGPYNQLITLAPERPGHDRRYALNATKIQRDLGWSPVRDWSSGLLETVQSLAPSSAERVAEVSAEVAAEVAAESAAQVKATASPNAQEPAR